MYSRIRYDIFFKKVFGQEHILKAFLNTVLEDELSAPIAKRRRFFRSPASHLMTSMNKKHGVEVDRY